MRFRCTVNELEVDVPVSCVFGKEKNNETGLNTKWVGLKLKPISTEAQKKNEIIMF